MLDIEIQNFQSIRHIKLTVEGFASIVGKSNIGKSAIVRALQYALTGEVGTDFVRHGPDCDRQVRGTKKCKCSSMVRFRTQKIEVKWEKGDQINRYTIIQDGETKQYDGLDRGTPSFLLPDFELAEVGDRKELVQIPDQFKPIFLLDQSGPAVADVLSDVAQLDSINDAMGTAVKERKEAVATRKVREKDIGALRSSLVQYDGLDAINVGAVDQALTKVTATRGRLTKADGFITRAGALKVSLKALTEATAPKLPDIQTLIFCGLQAQAAEEFVEEWDTLQEGLDGLKAAVEPELPNQEQLDQKANRWQQAARFMDELASKAPDIRRLTGIEKIKVPEDSDLQGAYQKLLKVDGFIERLAQSKRVIEGWKGLNDAELRDLDSLQEALTKLSNISDLVDRQKELLGAIATLEQSFKVAITEEEATVKALNELGACPTCEQPLGESHRLHLDGAA